MTIVSVLICNGFFFLHRPSAIIPLTNLHVTTMYFIPFKTLVEKKIDCSLLLTRESVRCYAKSLMSGHKENISGLPETIR